jgi:hypothetical protein
MRADLCWWGEPIVSYEPIRFMARALALKAHLRPEFSAFSSSPRMSSAVC